VRRLQLFLPDDLASDLDALARRELRTLRSQVVYMLRALAAHDRGDSESPDPPSSPTFEGTETYALGRER
jgi:hypothetical protein